MTTTSPQATTMKLSDMANLVLDTYLSEHPELSSHAKGRQGSAAIIRDFLPKLSPQNRAALERKYPELTKYK